MKRNTKRKSIRKSTRRVYKKSALKKGGECGCGNKIQLWGGNTVASFNSDLPANVYYPQNTYLDDSNDPSIMLNARILPNMSSTMGGKRKHKNRTKRVRISKRVAHIKGGGFSDLFLGANPQNAFLSSATSPGILDSYNTINMQNSVNPIPYIQPTLSLYHDNNLPLA